MADRARESIKKHASESLFTARMLSVNKNYALDHNYLSDFYAAVAQYPRQCITSMRQISRKKSENARNNRDNLNFARIAVHRLRQRRA
ncbi:hypothetical protein [Acidiphilium sp. MT5]